MTKIALITDTHFGIKNNSAVFRTYFAHFFEKVFLPYIDQHNIKYVVHLGDLFDNRKIINIETLKYVRETFIEPLVLQRNVDLRVIIGNHDIYYRNTNDVNSIKELFNQYKNIKIYETPTDDKIGEKSFSFLPWVNSENYNQFEKFVTKDSISTTAFGHLELIGYEVLRGIKSEEGYSGNLLSRFDTVYSGHFHMKHGDSRIQYLGTPYDMTFSDVDEKKGFHVLDSDTGNIEYIVNPYKMFFKIVYDDVAFESNIKDMKFEKYQDCYVKVIVKQKKNNRLYEKFITNLNSAFPAEVVVVEEYLLSQTYNTSEEISIEYDTLTAINKHIDDLGSEIQNPDKIKKIMHDLYVESFEVE